MSDDEGLSEITSIKITKGTRLELQRLGRKGESYNDIIGKLIKFFKEKGGLVG